jgi:hypothetical protein
MHRGTKTPAAGLSATAPTVSFRSWRSAFVILSDGYMGSEAAGGPRSVPCLPTEAGPDDSDIE